MNGFYYKISAILFLILTISCVTINKKSNAIRSKNEKRSSHCKVMIPKDSASLKIISETPLLDVYRKQKDILEKKSTRTDSPFNLNEVEGYYTGIFGCGVIEVQVTRIDGDHGMYLDGLVDETKKLNEELSFLVYGRIPHSKIDSIKYGTKYKVHWIETIVNMESFDEGYQRLFVVYKIE